MKKKKLETLIPAVRMYSEDTGMEFGIEKCPMLVMKTAFDWQNRTTKSRPD